MTESFAHKFRLASRAGLLSALMTVAACATDESDKKTAESPSADAKSAEMAADGKTLANCSPPTEKVHFKIANATLAVPGELVLDAIPAGMAPPITKEQVVAEVSAQMAAGAGCPGKPLDTGLLLMQDKFDHPLLDGNVGLLALPPGGITERFAAETRRLQQSPPKTCSAIGDDLIGCAGREKRGDTTTDVLYVITTSKDEVMSSGGPLAARCVLDGDKVEGCNLVDQLEGGLAIDASLRSGAYSTAGLRGALDAVVARVNAMRY